MPWPSEPKVTVPTPTAPTAASTKPLSVAVQPKKKKASKVPTDMTEDVVREVALPRGLVDNKVCAIDATWSGLRLVIRKELRPAPAPRRASKSSAGR